MTAASRSKRRLRLTVLSLIPLMGACQAPDSVTGSAVAASDALQSGSSITVQAVSGAGSEIVSEERPAIAVRPIPPIDDSPEQLMGLDPIKLERRLGPPELRRREPPAEVWQYRTVSCVLDLFLYAKSGIKEVVYVEARDFAAAEIEARQCLRALLLERRGSVEG